MPLNLWIWAVEPLEPRVLLTSLFQIEPIGDSCAEDSVPTDINDAGTVIGNCFLAKAGLSPSYAFTWTKQAGYQKLPDFDGIPNSADVLSPDGSPIQIGRIRRLSMMTAVFTRSIRSN